MKTAIKERPILFSGPMVRAILDGKKTVTRRVVKGRDPRWEVDDREDGRLWPYYPCYVYAEPEPIDLQCPYGQPGDRLWVRETFWFARPYNYGFCPSGDPIIRRGIPLAPVHYAADGDPPNTPNRHYPDGLKGGAFAAPDPYAIWVKRPSIHMPRRLCRIVLEVKSVRVERLQGITEDEAIAEGFERDFRPDGTDYGCGLVHAVEEFAALWDQLNADRGHSWESNPWVWRVEFERVINQG